MNKQAYLEDVYNKAFNDELEKIAFRGQRVIENIGAGTIGLAKSILRKKPVVPLKPSIKRVVAKPMSGTALKEHIMAKTKSGIPWHSNVQPKKAINTVPFRARSSSLKPTQRSNIVAFPKQAVM